MRIDTEKIADGSRFACLGHGDRIRISDQSKICYSPEQGRDALLASILAPARGDSFEVRIVEKHDSYFIARWALGDNVTVRFSDVEAFIPDRLYCTTVVDSPDDERSPRGKSMTQRWEGISRRAGRVDGALSIRYGNVPGVALIWASAGSPCAACHLCPLHRALYAIAPCLCLCLCHWSCSVCAAT